LLATRILGERRLLVALALALALATALTLLPLNAGLVVLGLGMQKALQMTWVLQALAILGLLRCPKDPPRWDREQSLCLVPVAAVYLSCLAFRLMSPDDDYWLHMPMQGSMQSGLFPPRNPFFIEIVMNGHYGRNLLMAGAASMLGCFSLMLEITITPLWMAATYVLFWATLRDPEGCAWKSHLGPLLIFFGVNCGLNSGLNSVPINNNPVVHLYLGTLFWLFLRQRSLFDQGLSTWRVGLVWGLVLGGYAIVYETHFGLAVLATASVGLLLKPGVRRMGQLLLPALLAAALATTQGGPLTALVQRKHDASQLTQGMQGHAQVVKLKFPKTEMLEVKLFSEQNRRARISLFYETLAPKAWRSLRSEAGYTPVYSWEFLKLHFLPTYLAPLTGWLLWRQRDPKGLWLWFFGFWAFLVPAVVDFGPIYESEYMRWEFAAALCWSACLGIQATRLKRGKGLLLMAIALCLLPAIPTTLGQWNNFRNWPGPRSWLLWPPTASQWLPLQGDPDFSPTDFQMAMAMRQGARPGERFLCDSTQESQSGLLYKSTLGGLTGVRCVGHSFPLDHEEIGLPPYRFAPAAAGFWSQPAPEGLAQMGIDWLVRRAPEGSAGLPGLGEPQRFSDGVIERQLYDLRSGILPQQHRNYKLSDRVRDEPQLSLAGKQQARGGQVYTLESSRPLNYWTTLISQHDRQLSPRDWLWNAPGQKLRWVAPSAEGTFELQLYGQDEAGIFEVKDLRWPVQVDYRRRMSQIQAHIKPLKIQAAPCQVIGLEAQFDMQGLRDEPNNHWLVALRFSPLQGQRRVDPGHGPRAKLQRLAPDPSGHLVVYGQVPQPAGKYSISLVVSPDSSKSRTWEQVGVVEVVP